STSQIVKRFALSIIIAAAYSGYAFAEEQEFKVTRGSALPVVVIQPINKKSETNTLAPTLEQLERTASEFIQRNKSILQVPKDMVLSVESSQQDGSGFSKVQFRPNYKGIPVVRSGVVVIFDEAHNIHFVNSFLSQHPPANLQPTLSENEAEQIVLGIVKKHFKEESKTTPFIIGTELMILPALSPGRQLSANDNLAWRVRIVSSDELEEDAIYFVDASSGNIIEHYSNHSHLNRKVWDCSKAPNDANCYIDSMGTAGYYHGRSESQPIRGPHNRPELPQFMSYDVDDVFESAADLHTYVQEKFEVNGPNRQGGTRVYNSESDQSRYIVHSEGWNGAQDSHCPGSAWTSSSNTIILCHNEVSADIIGHEFGHTITNCMKRVAGTCQGVEGDQETRAFAEAFSDIFGEAQETYKTGSADWLAGTYHVDGISRDLVNPHDFIGEYGERYAARFYDEHMECGEDPEGFYLNSTAISKAFQLVSQGGEFNGCEVSGRGAEFAAKVFFRTWDVYFSETGARFAGSYPQFLSACNDI
ncbi:MAG: M4 family metallopeptidase, partial [Bdellovibrionales bacterium]|nr:M4 family metallopeptidase [Bdellovibrionales bacterium]